MAKGSKGGKSSASAGTRKKNAKLALKKAGVDPDAAPKPPQRGQKGSGGGGRRSKKEPRKKVFVPPPKPPAPPPDPLDDYGLASSLPPALVVLTRKASKKDVVTRTRACEALHAWVAGAELEGETLGEEERKETEVIWLTCWAHLFPRLSISPTRRLRYLAASIHAALLEQAHTRSELVTVPAYVLSTLAPLAVLAHDTDRRVARAAKAALDGSTRWSGAGEDRLDVRYELHTLLPHLKLLLLSPSPAAALHAAGPSQPSAPGTPGTSTPSALDAKNRDDGSIEEDVRTTDGRLAAGAAGALCWIIVSHSAPLPLDDFEEILASSALWNLLQPPVAASSAAGRLHARPAEADLLPGSVGAEAPLARARAWAIIAALVSSPERAALDCALPAFGPVAIRAIWAETDATCARAALDALLPLLRIKPETWTMREDDDESDEEEEDEEEPSAVADEVEADDDSDEVSAASDSDDDEAGSLPAKAPSVAAVRSVSLPRALRPFQGWLRSACAGLPSLSYPTVLVLLSTLPVTLLAPTAEHSSAILDSHWAGLQARAGSDPQALRACIASFAECVAFLASRVARNEDAQADEASVLADAQLAKPWQAFVLDDGSIGADLVPPRARAALDPAQPISAAVKRLASLAEDGSVAAPFLARVRATLQQLAQPDADADALFRAVRCLSAIGTAGAPNGLEQRVSDLVQDVSGTAANVLCASPEETWLAPLVSLLAALMGSFADAHVDLLEVLGRAARDVLPPAMHRGSVSAPAAAAFYAAYLPMVQDASERSAVWISALESVSPQGGLDTDALQALFGAADSLPAALLSEGETGSTRLDQEVLALVARALKTGSLKQSEQAVLGRLLDRPEPFVTRQTADALLLELVTALKSGARADIATVLALLEAWGSSRERTQRLVTDPALQGAAAAIFGLAYLDASPEYGTSAARVWASLADEQGAPQAAAAMLRERVSQLDTPLRSLLRAAEALPAGAGGLAILPDEESMAECLAAACAYAPPPALAVVDALVPHAGSSGATGGPYDTAGLSSYARALVVLVDVLRRDRALARAAPWTLAHAVYLALAAEDATLLPGASPTLFAPSVSEQSLAAHAVAAVNVATTAVASLADAVTDAWHAEVAETLKKGSANGSGLASSLQVAYSIGHAQGARVFARLLAGVLSFSAAGATAGSTWLRLGQGIQTTKPALAGALMRTVRPTVLAAPLYDRVRNELVANLAGVPAARAESAGLPLLRLLVAAAPPADATVALVPPQRALLFLQNVQKWLAADDVELSDELHVRLSEVLLELLPIVEGMPGSHLELICDVLEAQLDAAAWSDAHAMHAALRLLEALEERSAHAEALRLVWKERSKPIRALLAPLFLQHMSEAGAPFDVVAQLLSHLVRRLPDDAFEGQEAALVEALQSRRQCVQLAAYRRLSLCIRSRVAALVLDAALEPEMAAGASALPDALIGVCCMRSKGERVSTSDDEEALPSDQDGSSSPPPLSFFLAWLAVFEHFEEASLSLRSAFAAQLEKRELLESELLPGLFEWMSPLEMRGWAVEEVYLDDVVFASSAALPLLAAHLYHRALTHTPVGVRKHVQSLRNRSLSTQITQLTSRHFTPLLAAAELAHLRAPEARATLEGEGLGVRITASNDVVATYTVDEHDMQIAVSIPADFPLHGVEVKDVKRVGVTEAQWRAWLLATQQLLTGKNGLIYDALLLFKRNAEAKFAGYEDAECAICYSIIGDGSLSLPTKKCKTCHKGYHSSCLVKWVVSSGSSTCPMCRAML